MAASYRHDKDFEHSASIFYFANDFLQFRIKELESIVNLLNLPCYELTSYDNDCPFKISKHFSVPHISAILSRSIAIRAVYEYICEGDTLEEIISHLQNSKFAQINIGNASFKVNLEPFNRSYASRNSDKFLKIDALAEALNMDGSVNLRNPDVEFTLFEYFGPNGTKPPDKPFKLYFGKKIGESNREQDKRRFSIKTRKFVGNTSMDPTLSLLMANMAGVQHNSLVLDPFVGTGSLILAAAHYGAFVCGTDINKCLLHGRGRSSRAKQKWRDRDENVRANFLQLGLESRYLDVMVADASKREMWRIGEAFDAIITDPPYGIREQTKKLKATDVPKPHFMPPTAAYDLSDVFADLLSLGAQCLKVKGRLVYWLPIYRPDYNEENIPRHACFKLVANCEQVLSTKISRRLIVMEKIRRHDSLQADELTVHVDNHYKESFRDRYFQPKVEQNPDQTSRAESGDATSC